MRQYTGEEQATDNERAFLEYVCAMRPSVGQRFIKNLIDENGHEAFENFWAKARQSILANNTEMELTKPEEKALAMALLASSRRTFLRVGSGLALCTVASLLGRSGAHELQDDLRRSSYKPRATTGEAAAIVLKLVGAGAGGVIGPGLLAKDDVSEHAIATIAQGEQGAKNVAKLVASLDSLFRPIEISLAETGAKRNL